MSGWLVALDFGTTSTAVAVRSGDGSARAVVFGDGSSTAPSSVFAEPDGRLLVGVEADNEAELRLSAYEPTPKRRISEGQIRLGDRDFGVAEVIGAVMAPVLAEAMAQHNNTTPSQVVLTHPVAWRARRRAVLAEALKMAQAQLGVGLPEPVFVAEPVAAAQWYTQTDPAVPGAYFAVYDLGGGTFDTTVLQATGEGFEVVASGGIDPLGGFDFDAALFDYLGRQYIQPADPVLWSGLSAPGQPDPDMARQRRRLQQRVGLVKLGLSTSPDKRIQLPGVNDPVVVTRSEYESLIAGHVDDAMAELERVIADAGLTPDQLTAIYRIGGAARTPLVGAALDRLHVPVKVLDQPKLVVAQGAATPQPTPTPQRAPAPQAGPRPQTLAATSTPAAQLAATPAPTPQTDHTTPKPQPTALRSGAGTDEDSTPPHDDGENETTATPAWRNRGRLALRVFAIVVLTIVLIGASGAGRALDMLLGEAAVGITAIIVALLAVIGAGIYGGFKHGPWEALGTILGGIAGLATFVGVAQASHWVGDAAGYVALVLFYLTRPARKPTAADTARHLGAGLSLITVTLAMTADYSNRRHLSFSEAFERFENGDLWIPAVAGLALVGIGAYYYHHCVTTQRAIYPRAKFRRNFELVVLATVFIPILLIQAVIETHPQKSSASAPPFDGIFTKSYGPEKNADGTPNGSAAQGDNEVVLRSTCGDHGCVAVSSGGSAAPWIWDYINGHWVNVVEYDDDTGCSNTASTKYLITTVSPQSDGSMAGDQIEEWTAGCYGKTPVTYRRTGGVSGDGQLPDPSTEAPRITSPAAGFHGRYRKTNNTDGASGSPVIDDFVVDTNCLRTGERCLSFALSPNGKQYVALVYQNGSWTDTLSKDVSCSEGTDHQVISDNLPLPTNATDPIQTLTGSMDVKGSNGCFATGPGRITFERTGD